MCFQIREMSTHIMFCIIVEKMRHRQACPGLDGLIRSDVFSSDEKKNGCDKGVSANGHQLSTSLVNTVSVLCMLVMSTALTSKFNYWVIRTASDFLIEPENRLKATVI